jgi:acyl-CoA thioesterase
MGEKVIERIRRQVEKEPYAAKMGLRLLDLAPGRAVVEMAPRDDVGNILGMTHGGAIFSLIDEAFQVSCNAHGTVAVALSMTLTYHEPPRADATLRAESREIHKGRRTGTYLIRVTDDRGALIATCQALAYRKQQPLPFLSGEAGSGGAAGDAAATEERQGGSVG